MRVKPTGGGAPPVDPAAETTGPAAASGIEGAGSVGEVAQAAGARAAGATDPVADIARRLGAGEISPQEAVELLIDDAVRRQVGQATADRERLAGELKELLRRFTETDPYLASKVRRLGRPR
jgi:hypothetical protein